MEGKCHDTIAVELGYCIMNACTLHAIAVKN